MILIERPALWLPSWGQGFARSQSEAVNPGLWNGLMGNWQPTLGPTGLTLFDVSGRGNNGTLSGGMDSTNWQTNSLDFNGTSDYVEASLPAMWPDPDVITIMVWANTAVTTRRTLIGRENAAGAVQLEYRGTGSFIATLIAGTFLAQTNVVSFTVGTFHQITYRRWGANVGEQQIWVDGVNLPLSVDNAQALTHSTILNLGRCVHVTLLKLR